MPECPHCGKEFSSWRAVGGHVGKKHRVKTVVIYARIPLSLKKEVDKIRKELGVTECQVITDLLRTYVSAHRAGILQSPPEKLIPSIITVRIGNGRKARKIMHAILEKEPTFDDIASAIPDPELPTGWFKCSNCGLPYYAGSATMWTCPKCKRKVIR